MAVEPDLASVSSLLADRSRARMMTALMAGVTRPASELAAYAGIGAPAASAHLAKLVKGGLIAVEAHGRHRYFRLASFEVAQLVEALGAVAPLRPVRKGAPPVGLQLARSCYDHLAGVLAIALVDALLRSEALHLGDGDGFVVTPAGERRFAELDIDCARLRTARRALTRRCLDWTERRPHLGGGLGAALLQVMFTRGWVERKQQDLRALRLTLEGRQQLGRRFDIDWAEMQARAAASDAVAG